MRRQGLIVLLSALLPACGVAPVQPAPAEPYSCDAPRYREFDFWLGRWDVVAEVDDPPPARNHISTLLRGCALHERYHSGKAFSGESISWYEPERGQWRQTWADSNGLILHLAGGLDGRGRMVMYGGERPVREGGSVQDRISWQPLAGGLVLQTWDISTDGGRTWKQVFSGRYLPVATAETSRHSQPRGGEPVGKRGSKPW